MSNETNGFKLIQKIGIAGMKFESTGYYTLGFDEAKQLALLVIEEIKSNTDLEKLKQEVENCEF